MSDDESLASKAKDGEVWKRFLSALPWVVALSVVGIVAYWAIWADSSPEWTGFSAYDEQVDGPRAKTLWDWMELLIIPVVLALGALWFNASQKKTELEVEEKAREVEREIARDRQQQATLEAYYDRMGDLLLNHNLRKTGDEDEERSIARARTLAVLRSLDTERKGQGVKFLYESRLIGEKRITVVSLDGADLSGADLSGADLREANLSEADLSGANLRKAYLSGADLRKARLSGANLSRAYLSGADLTEACLSGANLSGANLEEANLSGAYLGEANLSEANLSGTSLTEADLSGADLRDLWGWTSEQLQQIKSLKNAIMPDGTRYEQWIEKQKSQQAQTEVDSQAIEEKEEE